jgi:tRNA pseudouridine55 synthase
VAAGAGDCAAILCDKPRGVTSHDVVAWARRERGVRAGHAGTLDPFATGLLVVLLGRATRLQRYLMDLPKTYLATARLGWRSSTGDPDGELTETGRLPTGLELPVGRIRQRVPMTSAVKVGGERLYRRARRGESVETPEREVEIYRAELIESTSDRASYEIECSSGTYVRSLIETLGDSYCESLRRTAVGPFRVEDAGQELTAAEALSFLPERRLSEEEGEAVKHGRPIATGPLDDILSACRTKFVPPAAGWRVRLTAEGNLVAVARREGEELRTEVVLA